jgi:hypothetical protein
MKNSEMRDPSESNAIWQTSTPGCDTNVRGKDGHACPITSHDLGIFFDANSSSIIKQIENPLESHETGRPYAIPKAIKQWIAEIFESKFCEDRPEHLESSMPRLQTRGTDSRNRTHYNISSEISCKISVQSRA